MAALCFALACLGNQYRLKQRERAAAAHLIARSHAAPMTGAICPWPASRILGEDFFQHVRSIQMWDFKPDSVACAADLPYLEEVHIKEDEVFKSGELTAGDFQSLRGHRYIEELYINAPFDDAILTHFIAPRLRRLVLYQTRVTGPGLQHIQPDRLETLTLFRMPIGDSGMQYVSRFSELRNMLIQGTDVSDDGMKYLRSLSRLNALVLIDLKLSDDGLQHLPSGIKRLFVKQVPLTDAAIEFLAHTELQQLHLIDTSITSAGMQRLREILPDCTYRLQPAQGVKRTAGPMTYDAVFFAYPSTGVASFDLQRYSETD